MMLNKIQMKHALTQKHQTHFLLGCIVCLSVSGLAAEVATLGVKTEDNWGNNEESFTQSRGLFLFFAFCYKSWCSNSNLQRLTWTGYVQEK